MTIEEYRQLPDRISTDTLASYFKDILCEFQHNNISKIDFLEILIELTDRQVMTYELLQLEERAMIDQELSLLWNTDSYDEVDMILSIVVNLGLEKCYKIIKKSIVNNNNIVPEITAEIIETIEETGDNIKNPYYSLENL